ncbi:hypothetical protein Emag_001274 [Eimeria magna]
MVFLHERRECKCSFTSLHRRIVQEQRAEQLPPLPCTTGAGLDASLENASPPPFHEHLESQRMPAEEDHIGEHEGLPNNEDKGRTYASRGRTSNPSHPSVSSQLRRIRRSATSYPHIPRCLSNSLASQSSFQIGSLRHFERSEGRNSFISGVSSRVSSENSFWGCISPKSDEYMSACSGARASSASASRGFRRGLRGAAGLQLTPLHSAAFREASSEANVPCTVFENFTEEAQRQLSAPGLLLTAVPPRPSRSLPPTGSQPEAQPDALHSIKAFLEQAAAAQLGNPRPSSRQKACEPAPERRAASDQLEYKATFHGSCCGDHSVEEGQRDSSPRQISSLSCFFIPLQPQAEGTGHLRTRGNSAALGEAACERSVLLATTSSPSSDGSGNARAAFGLELSKLLDSASPHTPHSKPTVSRKHSPGRQDATRDREKGGEIVTSTFVGKRSSSWVAPFRDPSFSHSLEPTRSAECLDTEASVNFQSEFQIANALQGGEGAAQRRSLDNIGVQGVANPTAAANDAVQSFPLLTARCRVSGALSRSASSPGRHSWMRATDLVGAAVCEVNRNSSHEGRRRSWSCSSAQSSQSMSRSGPGVSVEGSSRGSSDCSSSSDNSRIPCSCSGSCSCGESVSSSDRSRSCSSVRSCEESSQSDSSGTLSTDSRFCSPMELAEADGTSLQSETQQEDGDSHRDAAVVKHWTPCYEDLSNGEGAGSEMGAEDEHRCEAEGSEQEASGAICVAGANADTDQDSAAPHSLPCIHFKMLKEDSIQPSPAAEEMPISTTATASGHEVEAQACSGNVDTFGGSTVSALDNQEINLPVDAAGADSMAASNCAEEQEAFFTAGFGGVSITSAGGLEEASKHNSLGDGHGSEGLLACAAAGNGPLTEAFEELSAAASASLVGERNELLRDCFEAPQPRCQMAPAVAEEQLSERARLPTNRGSLSAFFDKKDKRKQRSSFHATSQSLTSQDSSRTISEALVNRSVSERLLVLSKSSSQLSSMMETEHLNPSGEPLEAQRVQSCTSTASQRGSEDAVQAEGGVGAQQKSSSFPSRISPSHFSRVKFRRRHSGDSGRRASRGQLLRALELHERFPSKHQDASREALLECLKLHECIPLKPPVTRRLPSIAYSLELTEDEEDADLFEEEGGYSTELAVNRRSQEQRKAPLRKSSSQPFGSSSPPRHRNVSGLGRRRASCADVNDRENPRQSRHFSLPDMPLASSRIPVHAPGTSGNQMLQNADIRSADDRVRSEQTTGDLKTGSRDSFDEEAGPQHQDTRGFSKASAMSDSLPSAASPEFSQASSQAIFGVQGNYPSLEQIDGEDDVSADESEDSEGSNGTGGSIETPQASFSDGSPAPHDPFAPPEDEVGSRVSRHDNLSFAAARTAGDEPTGPQELQGASDPSTHRDYEDNAQGSETTRFPQAGPQEVFQKACVLSFVADRDTVENVGQRLLEVQKDSVESTNAQQCFHDSSLDLSEPPSCGPPPARRDVARGGEGGKSREDRTASDGLGSAIHPSEPCSPFSYRAAAPLHFQGAEEHNEEGAHAAISNLQVALVSSPKPQEQNKTASSSAFYPSETPSIYGGGHGVAECLTDEHRGRASRRVGLGKRVHSEPAIFTACNMSSELQQDKCSCSSGRRSDGGVGDPPADADVDALRGMAKPVLEVEVSDVGDSSTLLIPSSVQSKVGLEASRGGQGLLSCMKQLSFHERVHYLPGDDSRQSRSTHSSHLPTAYASRQFGNCLNSHRHSSSRKVLEEHNLHLGHESSVPATSAVGRALATSAEGTAGDIAAFQNLPENVRPTTKYPSEPALRLSLDEVSAQPEIFEGSSSLAPAMVRVGGCNTPLSRHEYKPRASRSVSFSGVPVFRSPPAYNKPREIEREVDGRQPVQALRARKAIDHETFGAGHGGSLISGKSDDNEANQRGSACTERQGGKERRGGDESVAVSSDSSHRELFANSYDSGSSSSDSSSGSDNSSSHGGNKNISREPSFHDALSSGYFGSRNSTMMNGDFRKVINSLNSGIAAVDEDDEGFYQASSLLSARSEKTLSVSTDGTNVTVRRLFEEPDTFPGDKAQERRPSTDCAQLQNSPAAGRRLDEESASAPADDSSAILAEARSGAASTHLTADHPAESTPGSPGGSLRPERPSGIAAALSSLAQLIFRKPYDGQCEDGSQQQSAPTEVTQTEGADSCEARQHGSPRKPPSKTEDACQAACATSEELEGKESVRGGFLKENKQQEQREPVEARPETDDAANPKFCGEGDEPRMVIDHDLPRDNSVEPVRDSAQRGRKSLADVQAVQFPQLASETAGRRQQLAAQQQLDVEPSASALLARRRSRQQIEGSPRSSSSERAPKPTDDSEPGNLFPSSANPTAEDSKSADEVADDAKASLWATEVEENQDSCLKSTDTSENPARLPLEDMRRRVNDLPKSLSAEIAQISAESKGDLAESPGSRRAQAASPGKSEVESLRMGEALFALQSSEEHQLSSEKLHVRFVSDAPVAKQLAAFQQKQEKCEFEVFQHQAKRAEPSDPTLERACSGHAQGAPSPFESFTVPACPAQQLPDYDSFPICNELRRRGIVEANRVLDGAVAHALRTPRQMGGPHDAGLLRERAKLDLLLGEAEKWGPTESTAAVPPATGGAEGDALEVSLSCASEAAVARRLALQQPALTCSLPPIFCNPCLSDSSLWNLQLRRQYSPNSNPLTISRPQHEPQEACSCLSASARRADTVDCGQVQPSEAANRSAGSKREQHEGKLASRKSSGSLVKAVVDAPSLPSSVRLQGFFQEEVGQASIRQPRAAVSSPRATVSPTLTMAKPRRPWACGEAPSVASEEPKPSVRTYVHKPGCRCSLCLSPGWGVPGSPRIIDVSTPRLASGLPVVPVQPGGYAAATPMRIVSSPIGPQPFYTFGGGSTSPFEPSGDAVYDAPAAALTARSYCDKLSINGPGSTTQHTYSPQQLQSPPAQIFGGSKWQSANYQNGTPRMNIAPCTDYPVVSGVNQIQEEDQPYGTPSFAVSPASRTPVSEGIKSNGASSAIPSRGVSSEEAEKIRLQQEYKQQQEEVRRRQEELEQQRARQQEEIEVERQLLKEQRERLEKQRKDLEREKQEILQARLQATSRGENNVTEQGADAAFVSSGSLTGSKGETDSFRFDAPRRQQGPPQRHTTSTSNIVRSITGSGLGGIQSASRLGSVAAEADAVEDREGWNVGSARHQQQQSVNTSRFFSRTASVDTMDDKETTALDKVAQIRMKLDTLQQQLEVQSHEVASYYSSLKAAEQVHGSLQQTAADCRVCFGRRNTQLQEVDKRLSVLTAQDLHPCSLEELEELAQELEGTQYKLTVVQAQRSGGAGDDNRKKPKQLLPYSSSCLPEPKSSFAIPEEPVSRIGPDECVALQETVQQEIKVLAEDLDHIKSVHLQFKKAYKRLQRQ